MTVLGEGEVVGHVAVQAQSAEPPIGQVEMHLFTQAPLRPDAEAVANQQHADQQFGIDRGAPNRAVERRHVRPDALNIHEAVDRPKQVVKRDMPLQRELVEQRRLIDLPFAHHARVSRSQEN